MKLHRLGLMASVMVATVAVANEKQESTRSGMADCPMHSEHAKSVDERGDKGMGFSHEKTTHHFQLLSDGGYIQVTVNDASDRVSQDQIRRHLQHIAKSFAEGNFETPTFVHDRVPPGVQVMRQQKDKILYRYEEIEKGARVNITTSDKDALQAVYAFLRFQITDHRTNDTLAVQGR